MARFATLAAFLLAASAAGAQTPDTTAAHRYLPLPVGAVWHYSYWQEDCTMFPICDTRTIGSGTRRVVGDSLVGGHLYAVVQSEGLAAEGFPTGTGRPLDLVRFDTTAAHGVARLEDGTEVYWPAPILRCPLNAAFGVEAVCGGGTRAHVSYDGIEVWVGHGIAMARVKRFVLGGAASSMYGNGLGLVAETFGDVGGSGYHLTSARVGGLTYGTITAAEAGPPPAAPGLRVLPNPVRGRATLHVALPAAGPVRLEAYDATGRRVHAVDVSARPAGTSTLTLDTGVWAPGLYVVRVTTADGQAATARLVRAE